MTDSSEANDAAGDDAAGNDGGQFDRLPATAADRTVAGRATRAEVVAFFHERYGIDPATFDHHTFWEKGNGKLWVAHGSVPSPIAVEAVGMTVLHTRQEHWKPTTDAAQRFGDRASRNVIDLSDGEAAAFAAGYDQELSWDGDWGYLIAAHEVAGDRVPIGVGLFVYGELRSLIPKGRREQLWDGE